MSGIFGSKGGTATTGQTSSQVSGPEQWMVDISKQMAGQGQQGFNQAFGQAQGISGMAPGMANSANQNFNAGSNMFNGAYDQAQKWSNFDQNTFQNEFMNPYVNDVVDQMSLIGNRDFNQQAAPSLMAQMGGSGQFGSSRGMANMEQASRDNQMNILTNQQKAMQDAYQNSMQNYQGAMQQGVSGANAMGYMGQGLGALGTQQMNAANTAQMMPGNIFSQYGAGMSSLPQKSITEGTSTGTTPVQGSGLFQF